MFGMNAVTGEPLSGIDHLKQSIKDVLMTPIGSRVMRREYGSRLFELLDRPVSAEMIAEVQAAVVMALDAHEPRFQLTKVEVKPIGTIGDYTELQLARGNLVVDLEGLFGAEGRQVRMENIAL